MNISNIYFNIVSLVTALAVLVVGLVIYIGNRKSQVSKYWFLSSVCAALWSGFFFLMINSGSKQSAMIIRALLDTSAILIMYFWLRFVIVFLGISAKRIITFVSVGTFILMALNVSPWFIRDVIPKYVFKYYVDAGPGYYLFALYFLVLATTGVILLIRKTKNADLIRTTQIRNIVIGSVAGFIGAGSVFLLSFNIYFPPFPFILFAALPLVIGQGIIKYNLFNVRVVATELFTLAIWVFITVRLILSSTLQDLVINSILLTSVIIFGVLLTRSVIKEVRQREKIQKLATDLEQANGRLKELDVMKTEFMSFASHQIRGPLTAIKGYASLLIEGDYGPIASEIKDPIDKIFQSSNSLAVLVEDYLNVSRIEQGRMKYEFTAFDLGKLVMQTAEELKPNIEKKGLKINIDVSGEFPVFGDVGKIKQVISNVIDNSAKYTAQGEISVSVKTDPEKKKATVTVKDTGVGIDPAVMPKLFQKFSRAMDASKANILGTGLGLYVARQLIEAHKGGKIWAESEGKDKGSTFLIELPLA